MEALKDNQVATLLTAAILDQLPFRYASYLKSEDKTKVKVPGDMDSAVKNYNKFVEESQKNGSKDTNSKKGKLKRTETKKSKEAKKAKEDKDKPQYKPASLEEVVAPRVAFYDIYFSPKKSAWVTQAVGYGELNEKKTDWEIQTYRNSINYKKVYYSHNSEGSSKQVIRILDLLKVKLLEYGVTSFWEDLFGTFDHSYVAIRYGYPTISGGSVLSDSYFIGILTEIRGGPAAGLRVYFDYAPEQSKSVEGEDFNFSWSRLSLGWSFDLTQLMSLEKYVHRVDITPKLGIFSVDFDLVTTEGSNTLTATFTQNNSIDFGFDLGVEEVYKTLLGRLWLGYNYSGLLTDDTTTSSLRGGLDLHYDFYQIPNSNIDIGLLAFGSFEQLSFTSTDNGEVSATEAQILELSYNLFYIGLGAELSW